MLILLPPSEGKAAGGNGRYAFGQGNYGNLSKHRKVVGAALAKAMQNESSAAKLLGVKGQALEHAIKANSALTRSLALPAHMRYSGVVWSHLDPTTLSDKAAVRAEESIVVVSGLLGVSGWSDPTPDYKVKIGSRLEGIGVLSSYWKPLLGKTLAKSFRGDVVVDLLPGDYAKAIDFDATGASAVLRVHFVDRERKAIGHHAKAVKGLFARHLLNSTDAFAAVESFTADGWHGRLEGNDAFISTNAG